jgi:lipopolysaccharide export LptBFGC system permease protein LptF
MKYIITESQFELLSESQEYLNFLLDKMNETGYESLTEYEKDALIRISQGEQVYEEPDETEDEEEEGRGQQDNRIKNLRGRG